MDYPRIPLDPTSIQRPYREEQKLIDEGAPLGAINELIYKKYPDVWILRYLGQLLWKKQIEIGRALAAYPKVSVRSANGMGKSFIAAALALWFFICFKYSKIVTTAPSERQVKKILWGEMHWMHPILKKSVVNAGDLLTLELRGEPGNWAVGYTADDADTFQGIHEENLLLVLDEANGIKREIWRACEGMTTVEGNKTLAIGNPDTPNTQFHETHTGREPGYYKIRISAFDSPNIGIDERGEFYSITPLPYPKITGLDWALSKINKLGRNDPWVVSRVFGEFPQSAHNQLISDKLLANALAKGRMLRQILHRLEVGEEVVASDQIRDLRESMKEG